MIRNLNYPNQGEVQIIEQCMIEDMVLTFHINTQEV